MKELIPFQFKTLKLLTQTLEHPWHPNLIAVHRWLIMRYERVIMTKLWIPGKGIHSMIPLRAEDIRSRIFNDPAAIEADINAHWIYDPERPRYNVAWWHNEDEEKPPNHFHIQVHDRTIYTGAL